MTRWSLFLQTLSLLHHFLGLYWELSGHIRALHSSSALAVNFFDYWTDRDKAPILSALGIDPKGGASLDFEAQFPTGLGGTPPHLDVAMTHSTGFVLAVEAKFTEHLKRSPRGKSDLKTAYFPKFGELWNEKGLPACQTLAEELRCGRQRFEYLDPRQLLKHALGLATQMGNRFSLYYLYYDWAGKGPEAHRREVDLFDERVGHEIGFRGLTYQGVFERLRDSGQAGADYLNYLESRYFPVMVWGATRKHSIHIAREDFRDRCKRSLLIATIPPPLASHSLGTLSIQLLFCTLFDAARPASTV